NFDRDFPHHGTRSGVLPHADPLVATSSPLLWAEALDCFMGILARDSRLDLRERRAVAGAAQQHGSVYLNAAATPGLARLDPRQPLVTQLSGVLSRAEAPIWMDSSTTAQCAAIAASVGGNDALARLTGSRAFERFTGPQIRKYHEQDPSGYAATERIHLVSSFLASLLIGAHAPIEPGDGAGMNLMDLAAGRWSGVAMRATAAGFDPTWARHAFGAATVGYRALVGFKVVAVARERVRVPYGLEWHGFSRWLRDTPPGIRGAIMLPWFEPVVTPPVLEAGVRRYGL